MRHGSTTQRGSANPLCGKNPWHPHLRSKSISNLEEITHPLSFGLDVVQLVFQKWADRHRKRDNCLTLFLLKTTHDYKCVGYVCLQLCLLVCFCFVFCFGFFVPLENFSIIWRRHLCRWRASNFDLSSALMAIEQ